MHPARMLQCALGLAPLVKHLEHLGYSAIGRQFDAVTVRIKEVDALEELDGFLVIPTAICNMIDALDVDGIDSLPVTRS